MGIRIARAAAGKEKVAFCGYHGWHDWYLAANLGSVKSRRTSAARAAANGVPGQLRGTIYPFNYNRMGELEEPASRPHDIGVIMMEVWRNQESAG